MFKFEWDPAKAASNLRKHGVDFDLAAMVFQDPIALSIRDEEHSAFEERWVTMGWDRERRLLVMSHADTSTIGDKMLVRIISARGGHPQGAASIRVETMKQEYDFSKGERSKFYRENARLTLPTSHREPDWSGPGSPLGLFIREEAEKTLDSYQSKFVIIHFGGYRRRQGR